MTEHMPSTSFSGRRHSPAAAAVIDDRSSQVALRVAMAAAVALLVACGIFAVTRPVHATIGDIFILGIAWVFQVFTGWLGNLLIIVIGALTYIATYNGFVTSAPVANGWSIVRDVTNMFFILVLLVIAFGTILGIDAYSYKNKMLSRLLIMAVVVNFSRTICGLLIDFAQVVMLTFVYGFREAAAGNFADALRITQVMQAREISDSDAGVTAFSIAIASILAFFLILIALIVVILMTITLAIRIVYLWLLVVMSPLAFFLKAVPGGSASGYYGMWWKMFTGQVIVGPVMAFFLWLSLVSVASGNLSTAGFTGQSATGEEISGPISEGFRGTEIQTFIISICLLMGGLQLSKQISSESAGAAPGIAKKAASLATRGAKALGRGAYAGADKISGGRVTQGKEALLAAGTRVPLVRGMAGKALVDSRQAREKKAGEEAKFMAGLPPDARKNFADASAWTEGQKIRKKEALRKTLQDSADKPPTTDAERAQFFDRKKKFGELGNELKDTSAQKELKAIEAKRPSLIINPNETDPTERARQEDSFRKAARAVNANKINEMDSSELSDKFLAFANPKAILEAQKNASGDQLERLQSMGGSEDDIRKNQDRLKSAPENFGINSEQERARLAGSMSDAQLAAIAGSNLVRPELLGGAVLDSLSKSGRAGEVADKVSVVIDYDKLRGDTNLAGQIADKISASALGRLPENIANHLRPLVAEREPARALLGGASMGQAFKGYDSVNGNFSGADGKAGFDSFLKDGITSRRAGSVPTDALGKNGGMNDVSMSVVSNVTMGDINQMIKAGNNDQAAAIMDVADKLSAMSGMNDDQIKAAMSGGMASSSSDVKAAIEKATEIMKDVKAQTNPMNAEMRNQKISSQIAAAEERQAGRLEGTERRISGRKRGKPRA